MNDSDDQSPRLNPFAPTSNLGTADVDQAALGPKAFSNLRIIFSVMAAVTLSGGLFALVLAAIMIGSFWLSNGGAQRDLSLLQIVLVGPLSMGVGLVIAGIASAILVPLCFLLRGSLRPVRASTWDRRSISRFGGICGFLCGLFPTVFLAGFGMSGGLVGLIPGGFSAFVTPLLLRRLLR